MGFESTTLYRDEARDPARSIPRATYTAVAFLALFYCLVVWAVIQAFGDRASEVAADNPAAMFVVAIERYVGTWAGDVLYLLVLTSVLASQVAFHNAINRYTLSLARDGLLPAALARPHPRHGSPAAAGTVQSLLAAVVVLAFAVTGADPYLRLLLLVNTPGVIGVLVLLVVTSLAVIAYLGRSRLPGTRLGTVSAAVTTVLLAAAVTGLVANLHALTGAGAATNAALAAVVPAVLVAAAVAARVLRARRPDVYARVGGGTATDAPAPPAAENAEPNPTSRPGEPHAD